MYRDREACYRALLSRDSRFDGRFFIAVTTTGIYCRPICPVRPPKLQHVVFMPSAAAAQEAGFRPCLRCRPEVSPDLVRWDTASATISRAMTMIAAGALNEATVGDLANRLGVCERQLRRLFKEHLGASPKMVAQTRRALLAKQLITETRLPLAQIAFAAGFGSVRRFNDSIQRLYRRPPKRLRRSGLGADTSTSAITLTMPYKAPYDWPGIIQFLAARAIPGVEHVSPDRYARTISLGDVQGTLFVRPSAPSEAPDSLAATINFPVLTALPVIMNRIRRMFDLSADPAIIGAHLSEDANVAPLVTARPGLRIPGAWDGFELAVCALIGQDATANTTAQLAGRIAAACGTPLRTPEGSATDCLRFVFPTPDRLVCHEVLERLGMPRDRARDISSLARAAAANPTLFEAAQGLEEALVGLTALRGVGTAIAHYITLRALREPDAFPPVDTLGMLPRSQRTMDADTSLARAAAWRPWRGYAALYLATADPGPHTGRQEKRRESVSRPHLLADRDDPARL